MSIRRFVPLSQITVSGSFPSDFYPVWVNDWGEVSINLSMPIDPTAWLEAGLSATGAIVTQYNENDYAGTADFGKFLATKAYVDQKITETRETMGEFLPLTGGLIDNPVYITGNCNTFDDDAAVTISWVQQNADLYLKTGAEPGGSTSPEQHMTGAIQLHSLYWEDYASKDAVPKKFLQEQMLDAVVKATDKDDDYVLISGDTMTGPLETVYPEEDCHVATLGGIKDYLESKSKEFFNTKPPIGTPTYSPVCP